MSNRPWTAEPTKATPTTADELLILDVADTNINKRVTIGSLPILEFFGPWTGTHNAGAQLLSNLSALQTDATNPATAGQIRLGNTQSIQWRNAGNDFDFALLVNANNEFSMNSALNLNGNGLDSIASIGSSSADAADVGFIRMGNSQIISWRNSADNGDHQLVFINDSFRMNFAAVEEYSFTTGAAAWNNNGITNIGRSDFNQAILIYSATQVLDFQANQYRQITLTGDLTTLSTSNRTAGRIMTIVVIGDTVDRNITFNTSWHTNPSDPSLVVSANSRVMMSFYCSGTAETDVIVATAEFA